MSALQGEPQMCHNQTKPNSAWGPGLGLFQMSTAETCSVGLIKALYS